MTLSARLALVIATNGLLRLAGGASAVLVGLYVADLAARGQAVGATLVGTLAAVTYGAELLAAVPMGMLADRVAPRALMTGGALLAAAAIALFGLSHEVAVFFVSRALEGLAVATGVPALLAYLTDATADSRARRGRVMSFFELSLLAGVALGGLLGGILWTTSGPRAFLVLAGVYAGAAALLFVSGAGHRPGGPASALAGLRRALREPAVRRLAPMWLAMNAIIGLWLGPTFFFLLTAAPVEGQLLPGLLAEQPDRVGWVILIYCTVFGTGLVIWSWVLPRVSTLGALRTSLVAMLVATVGLWWLNHSTGLPLPARWTLTSVLALVVMVESGFTPAALTLLAGALGAGTGRGAAMGIYSMLLALGALVGSLLAGVLGEAFAVDGLLLATLGLAALAFGLVSRLQMVPAVIKEDA